MQVGPGAQSVQPRLALTLARALGGAGRGGQGASLGVTRFDGQAGVNWAWCPIPGRNLGKKPGARGFRSLERPTLAT